ncbi:small acid-soluble spore protein Tlp [Oceanobacillus bengalensis]|uniref:Small, acid-soluble spore protein Tlp n=1 Tax=Oceanobacillus bengalensis TaxID=1435466 RepID=A0A494YSS6_9BACI|nr:small acid-soluble spore protein Tlp [Oceanobacillus bengalensis]RKQ13161.1 small acid-soluble spore protein Tlp [Oceanobacillus bengalensis]
MTHNQKPNPDDRSDNVEKLQNMVQDTIQNIEKSEETMALSDGQDQQKIREKNKRREEAIKGFKQEIKDEYQ